MKKIINTNDAPKAIGPYSQAIRCGNFLFISGQIPLNPITMTIESSDISLQTRQVLENLIAIMKKARYEPKHVVKCTVYLKNMNDFNKVNEVYSEYFKDKFPSRCAIEISRLPKDALIEIDAICHKKFFFSWS